jgi:hypothetical protein
MPDRNAPRTNGLGHTSKKAVPGPARCLFDCHAVLLRKSRDIGTLD